jgi:integrase/recombinase XerD
MIIRLKHLISDMDRHGNRRYYVRLPGKKKKRIKHEPHTEEFMGAYHDAVAGVVSGRPQAAENKHGSFRHLCVSYFAGDKFKANDVSTRNWQRRTLEDICVQHGHKPVKLMESRHVRKIRNEKKRAAANQRMKAMRAMFTWANEEEVFDRNPTIGVKGVKYTKKGHHSWTEDETAQYYARHSLGSKARLALDLIRYSACRREDVPRLGPPNIKDGRLKFRQGKNDEGEAPVDIDIPAHPVLLESIAAAETGHMVFLVTEWGKPFTTVGFGNKFKDWCRQADLPHCSAHGVRKATAAELASNQVTPHGIGSITGHRSLKEIENYTRAANQRLLADDAMTKLR